MRSDDRFVQRDDGRYVCLGLLQALAFVVLGPGYGPSPQLSDELKQLVKSRLAPHKGRRWIDFVRELPKAATGKTKRFKLRQVAAAKVGQ